MKPAKIATIANVTLSFYDETNMVALKVKGADGEIIFPAKSWQKLITSWVRFDEATKLVRIDGGPQ